MSVLGLRPHPTKSIHLYFWADKLQWKRLIVAVGKLVLNLSHSSAKNWISWFSVLILKTVWSEKQGFWKTFFFLEVPYSFSFSVSPNPAILKEEHLCLSFFCVAQKDLKKLCLKKTSCLTHYSYPSRSQGNTSIKANHLKFRCLNRSSKPAAADKQGLPKREMAGLQRWVPWARGTAVPPASFGARHNKYNIATWTCPKHGGEECKIFLCLKSRFWCLLVPSVRSYRQILSKY